MKNVSFTKNKEGQRLTSQTAGLQAQISDENLSELRGLTPGWRCSQQNACLAALPPCPRARVHPSSQPPPWWTSRGSARVPWWVWGRPGGLWPHPSQPHSRRGGTREDENGPGLHWEGRRRDGLSSRAGSVPGRATSRSVPRIRQVRPSLLPGRRRAAPPWAAQKQGVHFQTTSGKRGRRSDDIRPRRKHSPCQALHPAERPRRPTNASPALIKGDDSRAGV